MIVENAVECTQVFVHSPGPSHHAHTPHAHKLLRCAHTKICHCSGGAARRRWPLLSTSTNLVVIFYHLTGGPKLAPNWQPKCPRPSHFRLAVMSVTMSYNLIVGTRVLYSVMYSTHRCRRDRWRSISSENSAKFTQLCRYAQATLTCNDHKHNAREVRDFEANWLGRRPQAC